MYLRDLIWYRWIIKIKFCVVIGRTIFPFNCAASADETPHREIVRLAFRGFDYVIRGDWLEQALVRSNQFLLLIIRHSHPPWVRDLLRTLPASHLRHVFILWWTGLTRRRKFNPVENLFLNKMLKKKNNDAIDWLLTREKNGYRQFCCSQFTCKQSRRRARSIRTPWRDTAWSLLRAVTVYLSAKCSSWVN